MADRPETPGHPRMTMAHALDILDGIASGVVIGVCAGGRAVTPASARQMLWQQVKRREKARKEAVGG